MMSLKDWYDSLIYYREYRRVSDLRDMKERGGRDGKERWVRIRRGEEESIV